MFQRPRAPFRSVLPTSALAVVLALLASALYAAPPAGPHAGPPAGELPVIELLSSPAPAEEKVQLLQGLAARDLETAGLVAGELALAPGDLRLRAAAIDVLSRLPAERARPVLDELAATASNPHVFALAAEALRVLEPPRPASFDRLAAGLEKASDAADRRALVSQLGALEDEDAQALLWRVAADRAEAELVRRAAIEALVLPLDRPDLQARLESLIAEERREKASSPVLDALYVRQPDPAVDVPGELGECASKHDH